MNLEDIRKIAVIGTGLMGSGIAQIFLMAGFEKIILFDINSTTLKTAYMKIKSGLEKSEAKGLLVEGKTTYDYLNKLITEKSLSKAISDADFLIEVVPEDIKVKQEIFRKFGEYTEKQTLLASNTSTIKIADFCEFSNRPEYVVGMHFFLPPISQCCVEVMKTNKTDKEVFNTCIKIGEKLPCLKGKKRIVARIEKDTPGFIANRLLLATNIYLNWIADQALEKGIPFDRLDADVNHVMKKGPFELSDYVGLDTTYHSLKIFEKYFSRDFSPGNALNNLITKGNFGRKTGKGYYQWDKLGKPKINKSKKARMLNPEILMAIQLNEGCKLLEEKAVPGYKIIDDVMLYGIGTPGPFSSGKKNFVRWSKLLEEIALKSGKKYLLPCNLMKSGEFINMKN